MLYKKFINNHQSLNLLKILKLICFVLKCNWVDFYLNEKYEEEKCWNY